MHLFAQQSRPLRKFTADGMCTRITNKFGYVYKQVWARAHSKRLVFNRKIAVEAGSWSEIFHRPVYLHVVGAIIREHIDTQHSLGVW
jgi:hypothetical protein